MSVLALARWGTSPDEPPGAPSGTSGTWTALGGVAVLAATRGARSSVLTGRHAGDPGDPGDPGPSQPAAPAGAAGHTGHAGHAGHAVPQHTGPVGPAPSDPGAEQSPHAVWDQEVVVDLEVSNGTGSPVRLSSGQFRLRLDDECTVSYLDAEREVMTLAAGETITTWVSFLMPATPGPALLDYTAAGAQRSLALPLPLRHGSLDLGRAS